MFQPLTLIVAVSLAQTAFSMPTVPIGQRDIVALEKRAVTNLPTSLITCRMYTHISSTSILNHSWHILADTRDGLPGDKTVSFNDFQAEDAAQQGLGSAPGTSDPNPGESALMSSRRYIEIWSLKLHITDFHPHLRWLLQRVQKRRSFCVRRMWKRGILRIPDPYDRSVRWWIARSFPCHFRARQQWLLIA